MNIQILKIRRGIPTVILLDGHRYVLDPNAKIPKKQRERGHKLQSAISLADTYERAPR